MTVLSTSVFSPFISSWIFFDVLVASSRTRRVMRWNTVFTGCARIDITLFFSSVVWGKTSSIRCATRLMISGGSSWTTCPSMACAMTISPTMLTTPSILSSSTRIVVAAAVSVRIERADIHFGLAGQEGEAPLDVIGPRGGAERPAPADIADARRQFGERRQGVGLGHELERAEAAQLLQQEKRVLARRK